MSLRVLFSLGCLLALVTLARGGEPVPASGFKGVEIKTTKTSIYVGSVTMTMPAFVRTKDGFASTYKAKVFPYVFSNEAGTIAIAISEAALRQLQHGEPADFTGEAVNGHGEPRRIQGKATPTEGLSGKIKVRVFVSEKIQLIFNTHYRLVE